MATFAAEPTTSKTNFVEEAREYLKRPAIMLSGIALITFLLYISTLSFAFVWDDHVQVESNPLLLSWKAMPRAFHSSLWFQLTPDGKGSYYRPFFILWSALNHSLFGFRPWGWHLTNVVLHIIASYLVFVLLRRLKAEYWSAAIATLAFALHPVHIEPVAWVSAGADLLAAVLYLLTFLCFLESRNGERRRMVWISASCFLLACALLTKEMALTFPGIVIVYLWLFPREGGRPRLLSRMWAAAVASLPYVVLDVLYLAQRARVLHSLSQVQTNQGPLVAVITLPIVLMNYLRLLIFPTGLTGLYYVSYVRSVSFDKFVLPTIGLAAVTGLVWWWSKRERDGLIAFFGIWIPVSLIPVLYLPVFKEGDFVRDRYLYLPSVGICFLLGKAIRRLPLRMPQQANAWLQPAAVAVLFVLFAAGVLTQQIYWASDLLVFDRGYSLYPHNATAAKYVAAAINRQGDPAAAMRLAQQAIVTDPDDSYSHWLLAVVESELHQDEQANQELTKAVNLSPQYYLQTSHGLTSLGQAFAAAHNFGQAENCLRRALQIEPDATESLLYMGMVLLRTDRPAEAETYLKRAALLDPEGYGVNWGLGMLAQLRGDRSTAARQYSEELRLHPENRGAQLALATLAAGQ